MNRVKSLIILNKMTSLIYKGIEFQICYSPKILTVNPQKRPAGLILSLRVQMRVLLEFGPNLGVFVYCFLSFLRVLLECGSYLRAGLIRGFALFSISIFLILIMCCVCIFYILKAAMTFCVGCRLLW